MAIIGEAAAGDVTRHLVKEGDQSGQTLVGWFKIDVQDEGGQIATASYYCPLYILGTEVTASVPSNVNDADTLVRETWRKQVVAVAAGVDDADSRG